MYFIKCSSLSAVLVLIACFNLSFSQLIGQGVQPIDTEATVTESTTETPSVIICTVCACEDGVINCANSNISVPFEETDWEGISTFQPITVDLSNIVLITVTKFIRLPIQELKLSNCQIESIQDGSFNNLEDLKSLDLSYNKITTEDLNWKCFLGPLTDAGPKNFKQMSSLSLAHNDIHSLPQDLFMFMPLLTSLDLSGNPLADIDQVSMAAISVLTNLRTLALSGCELETLPEGLLRRQRKLRRLDLSNNRFTAVPAVLQEAPRLVYLNLDKNAIQAINGKTSLSNLTSLEELSMCRMSRLQNITAGALGGMSSLVILRLCYNPRLTNLHPEFLVSEDEDGVKQWPDIKELYLNNNNLSRISSHTLDSWNELVTGDFSSNPYDCDCNCQWMVDVLTPLMINTPRNSTVNHMVCMEPSDARGLTFWQLNDDSKTLICTESESLTDLPVSNLAILLGVMIGIIVTFPLVLVLVLLWRKGYFAKCRREKRYPGDSDEEHEDF
ncbi:CD180 antigen-like [Anticarsia gemmatalis]|uniref:CD180 antigen-like n=1 Tax=Anticarsia gemmatalis TaxID=129554 RepID=UPI003F769311